MVQQKFINRYVNLSKTKKLCKHTYNTRKTCPASVYLFKVYNKNTRTRCEICSEVIIKKKTELKVEKWKSLCSFYL